MALVLGLGVYAGQTDRQDTPAQAGSYAADALSWAMAKGIISGKGDGRLDPLSLATRAEVATILARYCRLSAEQ